MTQTVQLPRLPESVDEFLALRDATAHTPEGGAAMMVVALLLYAQDRELGEPCLTIAVARDELRESSKGYKGWALRAADLGLIRSQVSGKAHILRSYFQGATPENRYTLPEPPYSLVFSSNPYSGDPETGTFKVFVDTSGASTARPITVRRNEKGIWKAIEWSSLIVGVQAPPRPPDDL